MNDIGKMVPAVAPVVVLIFYFIIDDLRMDILKLVWKTSFDVMIPLGNENTIPIINQINVAVNLTFFMFGCLGFIVLIVPIILIIQSINEG